MYSLKLEKWKCKSLIKSSFNNSDSKSYLILLWDLTPGCLYCYSLIYLCFIIPNLEHKYRHTPNWKFDLYQIMHKAMNMKSFETRSNNLYKERHFTCFAFYALISYIYIQVWVLISTTFWGRQRAASKNICNDKIQQINSHLLHYFSGFFEDSHCAI